MARVYTGTYTFSPNLPLIVNHEKPNAVPVAMNLETVVKFNHTGTGDDYDEFFLGLQISHPVIGGVTTPLINFSGHLPDAPDQRMTIVELNDNATTIAMSFANLASLANGSYDTRLRFMLIGRRGTNPLFLLDAVSDIITTNVTGTGGGDPPVVELGIDPGQLVFTHALDGGLPASQTVAVTSEGAFKASVFGPIVLSGPGLTLVSIINGVKEYSGMVDQTVTVALHSDVANELPGAYEHMIVFSKATSRAELIGNLGITLYIFENSDLVINPTALEFFAIKDIQEAPSQTLSVAGTPAFTLTRPSWLIVTPTEGQGFTDITVTPNPTSTLDEGEYLGDIMINDGTNNYIIPIIHNVYGNVQLGAKPNKINFTDDYNTISWFYEQENYKLLLNLDIDFFDYGATLLNETTLDYVLGFFNNRTKFFIGQTLNSIMKELLKLQAIRMDNLAAGVGTSLTAIRNYYLPAKVDITTLFKHDFDDELDKTETFQVKFIKGRRPKTAFDDTFILDYYRDPLRVTVNSVAMFNFYKEKNHVFRIYKNGVFEGSISHSVGTQRIFGHKVKFTRYAQGDVVEYRLYKNIDSAIDEAWFNDPANYIAQQYIVVPEGKASHHIGYEDEHGLLKIIEFTGGISFENAYENTVAKNYEEFLETLKKLDSKKSRKCTIDTGFIFKSNTKNIDALLSSNRAWLISKKRKQSISMIPTNKSMSDEDSDQDLYAYNIEFEINFNNDFEINT